MPAASAIRAGRAYVELFADDSQLIRGLKSAQKRMTAFGKFVGVVGAGITAAGAAITAPFLAAAQSFAAAGDKIHKMGIRTGVSAESLSQLSLAASLSGSSIDTLGKGISKMQKTITDGVADFEGLGVSLEELQKLSPEQQFLVLADRIAGIDDPTRQAAMAMEFFGRSGIELLPMLKEGGDGIVRMMKEADRLGLTMGQDTVNSAAALTDAQDRLNKSLSAVWITLGAAIAPVLTDFFNLMAQAVAWGGQWVRENQDLLRTIFLVGVALGAVGSAITALGVTIAGAGVALGGLATGLGVLGSVLGVVLSPVGIAIGLLGGLAAYALQSGASIEWLTATFGPLGEFAIETFEAIKQALMSGDFQGAADILMKTLQLAFTAGINELEKLWLSFRDFFLNLWDSLSTTVLNLWDTIQTEIAAGLTGLFTDDAAAAAEAAAQLRSDSSQRKQQRSDAFQSTTDARQQAREEATIRLNAEIAGLQSQRSHAIREVQKPREVPNVFNTPTESQDTGGGQQQMEALQRGLQELFQRGAALTGNATSVAGTFSAEASRQFAGKSTDQKQIDELRNIVTAVQQQKALLEEVLSAG